MKKISCPLLFLLISLCLSGCVKDTADETRPEPISEINENGAYIAEPLLIPHKLIYCDAVFEDILYYVGNDGGADEGLNFVKIDLSNQVAKDNFGMPTVIPLDIPIPSGTKLLSEPQMMLAIDSSGGGHILVCQYYNDRLPVEAAGVYWHQLDAQGQLLRTFDLSNKAADGTMGGIYDFLIDGEGNAFIAAEGYGFASSGLIHVITANGEAATAIQYDGTQSSLFPNGREAGILYRGEAGYDFYVAEIDLATESLTGIKKIGIGDVMHRSMEVKDADILSFATGDAVFDYNVARQTISERFIWADVGIVAGGHFTRAFPLNGNRVLFSERYAYDDNPYKLIRPMTCDEIAEAKANMPTKISIITVALNGSPEHQIKPIITAYNLANPDKQVELVSYFDDRPDDPNMSIEDLREWGFKQQLDKATLNLELDIIRGQGPDIVISRNTIPLTRYAKLGIFEDLNPYLDADDAFNWSDYHEHLIRAYEVEGKLYAVPVFSFFKALIVRQADIRDYGQTGWNIDEFIAFVDSFGSDHTIFAKPTKTAVLDLCLYANGDILVDWDSREIGFNRDFATKVLGFANRFIDDDIYFDDTPLDLRAGKNELKIYSPRLTEYFWPGTLDLYSNIMGEPVSFIGFPSENGSGIITGTESLVSLTAGCRDKEAAWHFLSYYFAETLLNQEAYRKYADSLKSAGTMTQYDPRLSTSYNYRADDNGIAAFFDLLMNDVQIRIDDQAIENIIKEEAGIYFSGSKSLDEVVDVIENRVSLYVSEMK